MAKEIEELQMELDGIKVVVLELGVALKRLSDLKLTREKAIAITKIEEAGMWLEKRQEQLSIELAIKTCR